MPWKVGSYPTQPMDGGSSESKKTKIERGHEKKTKATFAQQRQKTQSAEKAEKTSLQEKRAKKLERSSVENTYTGKVVKVSKHRLEKVMEKRQPPLASHSTTSSSSVSNTAMSKTQAMSKVQSLAANIHRLSDKDFVRVMDAVEKDNPQAFKELLKHMKISHTGFTTISSFLPLMQQEEVEDTVEALFRVIGSVAFEAQEKIAQFLAAKISDPQIAEEFLKSFRVEHGLRGLRAFDN